MGRRVYGLHQYWQPFWRQQPARGFHLEQGRSWIHVCNPRQVVQGNSETSRENHLFKVHFLAHNLIQPSVLLGKPWSERWRLGRQIHRPPSLSSLPQPDALPECYISVRIIHQMCLMAVIEEWWKFKYKISAKLPGCGRLSKVTHTIKLQIIMGIFQKK